MFGQVLSDLGDAFVAGLFGMVGDEMRGRLEYRRAVRDDRHIRRALRLGRPVRVAVRVRVVGDRRSARRWRRATVVVERGAVGLHPSSRNDAGRRSSPVPLTAPADATPIRGPHGWWVVVLPGEEDVLVTGSRRTLRRLGAADVLAPSASDLVRCYPRGRRAGRARHRAEA